jgi:hypothetical protein
MIPRLEVITWLYGGLTSLSRTRTKYKIVMFIAAAHGGGGWVGAVRAAAAARRAW